MSGFRLIDAKEAAKMLCLPHTWLLAEAREDRVPHMRCGRYVRFDPVALEAWAKERERGPQAKYQTNGRRAA